MAIPVIDFTKTKIDRLNGRGGAIEVKFKEPKELRLRVSADGVKSFRVVKRLPGGGKLVDITVGRYGELPLAQIKATALELIAMIAKGVDPRVAKAQQRQQNLKSQRTFQALWDLYIQNFERLVQEGERSGKSLADAHSMYRCHIEGSIANQSLDSLTKAVVKQYFSDLREAGSYAIHNKVLKLVSAAFEYAIKQGELSENPVKGISKMEEVVRERFLNQEEVLRLLTALEQEKQIYQDLIMLFLLTGQRKSNVLSMRWHDVHLDDRLWVIPARQAKGKKTIGVPLVEEAVTILKRRSIENTANNEFVFPSSHSKSGHLSEKGGKGSYWYRVKQNAGLNYADKNLRVRVHDLRRTLASHSVIAGSGIQAVSKVLGHSDIQMTARTYAHLQLEQVRDSVQSGVNSMLDKVKSKDDVDFTVLVEGLNESEQSRLLIALMKKQSNN
ncbi:tyrosine-type recombinase/integrase [Ferrimonas aestuarii]|uniref:Site-specific integrase n=1 Tax=Ferrimonas aestuarii TaxID=2569539 RepID=A0A4U1BT77_9GAMM|nr:site-specific integrase [Ferrimonas aestuarii]TKB58359.1 site-specific integrase [Ferrimonas aestuarii]